MVMTSTRLGCSELSSQRSSSATEGAQILHNRRFFLLGARECLSCITGLLLHLTIVLLKACVVLLQSFVDILQRDDLINPQNGCAF